MYIISVKNWTKKEL